MKKAQNPLVRATVMTTMKAASATVDTPTPASAVVPAWKRRSSIRAIWRVASSATWPAASRTEPVAVRSSSTRSATVSLAAAAMVPLASRTPS
jgi:hypothetical protein